MRPSRDFQRLWLGQSISALGSQVTDVALPLVAVLVLHATPFQMGWLVAAERLPLVFVGLAAGVWIDRMRRQPVLVATDFVQAALLVTIPLAALFGVLHIGLLYAVAFGTGAASVVAVVAERAYVPSLLPREELVAGNSRLQFSWSLAQTIGPGLAGVLVQALTAPVAIVVDVASFVASGFLIRSIRHPEKKPEATADRRILPGVLEGLRRVAQHPVLRPLVLCGATHNFFSTMIVAVYILYLTTKLGMTPAILGFVLVAGGVGSVLGSLFAGRAARRVGIGPALIASQALTGVARLLIPLAAGPRVTVLLCLLVSELLLGAMRAIFNITQISLRQAITPAEVQGRVNASIGFLLWAITPIGAIAGGALGGQIGIRPTLAIAATGVLASTLWALVSELRVTKRVD